MYMFVPSAITMAYKEDAGDLDELTPSMNLGRINMGEQFRGQSSTKADGISPPSSRNYEQNLKNSSSPASNNLLNSGHI